MLLLANIKAKTLQATPLATLASTILLARQAEAREAQAGDQEAQEEAQAEEAQVAQAARAAPLGCFGLSAGCQERAATARS